MTVNIIGCGETAEKWDGKGFSIGVNDSFKFGHKINNLIVIDAPSKFSAERFNTIKSSKPDKFFTHDPNMWNHVFKEYKMLFLEQFTDKVVKGTFYCSRTSPMVAISMAFAIGAKNIILWGVDFKTHPRWREGYERFADEFDKYLRMIDLISKQGTQIFLGSTGSSFDKYLKVWSDLQ